MSDADTSIDVDERPTVIFLHIGKTAGTTLRHVLRRNFRGSETMVLRVHGRPRDETLDVFAALPESERARPRLVMGHTIYGLHASIPRPSVYVTMLRNPSSLVVSQYRYVLRTPGHRHHDVVTHDRMSLEEYIERGISLEMDNSQTRAIAGDRSTPYGACSDDMLKTAKRHIDERFPVVGLTERLAESVVLLGKVFGWSRLHYVNANVSPAQPDFRLSDRARQLIEEHNRLDRELYAYCRDRFDRMVATYPTFAADIERLGRENRRYRPFATVTQAIPARLAARIGVRRSTLRRPAESRRQGAD